MAKRKSERLALTLVLFASIGAVAVASPFASAAGLITDSGALSQSQVAAPPTGPGSNVEEVSAIESAMEARVHDILDGIVKSNQYAVYVQVSMKSDPQAIQAYYDERSLANMPGINGADPSGDAVNPANDRLYSLVQKKKIIVVLDKSVTGDQELIAKDVLIAKLGIDQKAGDAIEIRRSEVPTERVPAGVGAAQATTASWVKYAIGAVALALAIGIGLLLWQLSLMKEKLEARAKLAADVDTSSNRSASSKMDGDGKIIEEGTEGSEAGANGGDPATQPGELLSTVELKDKILTLAVSHPRACSVIARKLLATRDGTKKMAVVSEAIGFEYAKQLFDNVNPVKWKAMGQYLRENLAEVSKAPVAQILTEIYTDILAESMGIDTELDFDDPFEFLHKLSDTELNKLLSGEAPAHVASIAAFWGPEEMTQILTQLPEGKRKETVLHIARLQNLPKKMVQEAAVRFAERLKDLRSRQEVDADGSQILAKVLGNIEGSTEEDLLNFIEQEDPEARKRLKNHYFTFDSLDIVPKDILTQVIESVPNDIVIKALVGAKDEIVQALFGAMAPRQRSIVEDDLRLTIEQGSVSKADSAVARRTFVTEIREIIKDRGISLTDLLAASSRTSGETAKTATEETAQVVSMPTDGNEDSGNQAA